MRRRTLATLAGLALLPSLQACGFSPLYATDEGGIRSELRSVAIGEVAGPPDIAYYTQGALTDALPRGDAAPRYTLAMSLREQTRAIAVTRSSDTTRFDYQVRAAYTLTDNETGAQRRNSVQSVVSYGVVASQYASLVGREDAVRRAALDLSRRIETDVALYLKGRAPETGTVPLPDVIDDEGRDMGEPEGMDLEEQGVPTPDDATTDSATGAGSIRR